MVSKISEMGTLASNQYWFMECGILIRDEPDRISIANNIKTFRSIKCIHIGIHGHVMMVFVYGYLIDTTGRWQ